MAKVRFYLPHGQKKRSRRPTAGQFFELNPLQQEKALLYGLISLLSAERPQVVAFLSNNTCNKPSGLKKHTHRPCGPLLRFLRPVQHGLAMLCKAELCYAYAGLCYYQEKSTFSCRTLQRILCKVQRCKVQRLFSKET